VRPGHFRETGYIESVSSSPLCSSFPPPSYVKHCNTPYRVSSSVKERNLQEKRRDGSVDDGNLPK